MNIEIPFNQSMQLNIYCPLQSIKPYILVSIVVDITIGINSIDLWVTYSAEHWTHYAKHWSSIQILGSTIANILRIFICSFSSMNIYMLEAVLGARQCMGTP